MMRRFSTSAVIRLNTIISPTWNSTNHAVFQTPYQNWSFTQLVGWKWFLQSSSCVRFCAPTNGRCDGSRSVPPVSA